ncbi:MAG TPA: type II toxin-antitoxin system VapC family toxin [Gammaproteobacteria bacterium]|jgi:predicted nucleic acid-binding protein|nr:type II toxin-antitoxin system VapC family toxin [Gammaproteobacteria bacterium]
MKKNVVDSSGWLEYFANASNADFFAPAIENTKNLIVPSISILEVFKHVLRQTSEKQAFEAIECMLQGTVIDLDTELSLHAAKLGIQYKIPLADSIIFATALTHEAIVWSQDADFDGLPQVKYIAKR